MKIYNNNDGSTGRISTSKGNQVKMKIDGYWYKMDYLGYEGLAEYLASELLAYTNIQNYVKYEMTEMTLNEQPFNGCRSEDFLKADEEIITADKLFKVYVGMSVAEFLQPQKSLIERISSFVNKVQEITGIKNYGQELTKILEWDGFIFNDDRHFNNIAFVYNSKIKAFSLCPLFDNGAAFLSDMRCDYPLEKNVYGLISGVKAKPFSEDFDKQIKACEKLYGIQLKIDKNICISTEAAERIKGHYGDNIYSRVNDIFEHQKMLCDYLCELSERQHDYSDESHLFDDFDEEFER